MKKIKGEGISLEIFVSQVTGVVLIQLFSLMLNTATKGETICLQPAKIYKQMDRSHFTRKKTYFF